MFGHVIPRDRAAEREVVHPEPPSADPPYMEVDRSRLPGFSRVQGQFMDPLVEKDQSRTFIAGSAGLEPRFDSRCGNHCKKQEEPVKTLLVPGRGSNPRSRAPELHNPTL
ncbi:hypothetical protein Bbelb_322830 [Branchiostoma belcheri]|nr:hypothetical protein Bbelb_322830 [Branchiostoma belcheri]